MASSAAYLIKEFLETRFGCLWLSPQFDGYDWYQGSSEAKRAMTRCSLGRSGRGYMASVGEFLSRRRGDSQGTPVLCYST
jgi:hypothetical protein